MAVYSFFQWLPSAKMTRGMLDLGMFLEGEKQSCLN